VNEIVSRYAGGQKSKELLKYFCTEGRLRVLLQGLKASAQAVFAASVIKEISKHHLFVISDKERAAFFFNDLQYLFDEVGKENNQQEIFFFPHSYKKNIHPDHQDSTNLLMRIEVLKRLQSKKRKSIIVTYPAALIEKVVQKRVLVKNSISLRKGENTSMDEIEQKLEKSGFEWVEFVYEPGQYAVRGGIIDVFSYTDDYPFRIEFFDDEIESIRAFNPVDQLSIKSYQQLTIVPNVLDRSMISDRINFFEYLPQDSVLWFEKTSFGVRRMRSEYEIVLENTDEKANFASPEEIRKDILNFSTIEMDEKAIFSPEAKTFSFDTRFQRTLNRNFELLQESLREHKEKHLQNYILSPNPRQLQRIKNILTDVNPTVEDPFVMMNIALHEGFVDEEHKLSVYVDHQIFGRYHKFHLKKQFSNKEAISLKELTGLKPGDFVTHIDHGIGRFGGLEKITVNGKEQESIRLIYNEGDLLYVSIHSLHRISKYTGKEGTAPPLHRLGSKVWQKTKAKTKSRIKDIAKDLIELYAKRKASKGMQYSPDTYLQHELEASFIYEDTPDQVKATQDVKADMEKEHPMDRLVCGDVGFGKTEVAIRAAFKAVADSKQVAVLVPTTILALQHAKSFADRLKEMPCKVDYINRFRTAKEQNQIKKDLKDGKIDILIGTHRLLGSDIEFKDLGLVIIDEEQKFGVAMKEKLKKIKVNVDTLTLTATPIPRTLQFSLMGARDLSIINTPPPNRYPIQTELHSFGEKIIKDAISFELNRGGQVFFVHNRVHNIDEVAAIVRKFVPEATIAIGHGQMDGKKLEKVMLDFINARFDILISTTIVESGLDIPNANTIIINDAHNYGLSDLHQLRGRVGRSNKKAFCYLLTPPVSSLSSEAQKRLRAIEEFSDLGSGFNIAMRDLDIRGAGDVLGGEQSGFISDIGYETYQKILDEAIAELKENEYRELYKEENQNMEFVRDCQIDTDMSILLPDEYISDIGERLRIYKELDELKDEDSLSRYVTQLKDRFGTLPPQTLELIDALRLRWTAKQLGIEKIILKKNRMICYFVKNQESPFYQSDDFVKIMQYVQLHPQNCIIQEKAGKLSLQFYQISTVSKALQILRGI
jgi:transcription-repair coupling factor (superfamily II helicase)